MQEADRMAIAQNQRDRFVPHSPPGRWDWCPKCGRWSPPGECPHCQKREKRLQMMQSHMGEYLESWLAGIKDRDEFLLEGYRARRERLLREGDFWGLLAMEQAEEEFVAGLEGGARMEPQKKSILLYLDMLPMLESLPPASCGKVVVALLRYASTGQMPQGFRGAEKMALDFIRAQVDRDMEKYRHRCETNRKNALRRSRKQTSFDLEEYEQATGYTEEACKRRK